MIGSRPNEWPISLDGMSGWRQTKPVLQKRYTLHASTRYGYDVYTPLDRMGMYWAQWFMSSRPNPTPLGSVRLISCKIAKLCESTRYFLAHNAGARSGTWYAISTSTVGDIDGVYTTGALGEAVTYTVVVPEGGRILWEWIGTTVSGRAYVAISTGGAPIDAARYDIADDGGGNRYVDTLKTGTDQTEVYKTSLASGLTAGTYTVLITASGALATKRIYERALYSIDDSKPGNPSVMYDATKARDPFVVQASPAALLGVVGNLEYAWYGMLAGGTLATDLEYASGIHGYETGATGFALTVDGVDITATFIAATTYQGHRWVGRSGARASYATTLSTRVGATTWANLGWVHEFSLNGYSCELTREALVDVAVVQEYIAMNMAPNLANGGANKLECSGVEYTIGTVTPGANVSYHPALSNQGSKIVGPAGAWISDVSLSSPANIESVYVSADQDNPLVLVTDRADGYIKDYRSVIYAKATKSIPVLTGDSKTFRMYYRVYR